MIDENKIEEAIVLLLEALGEEPSREGLIETPKRVSKMYSEIFKGKYEDPKKHLKTFDIPSSTNIITVCDIPFYSICEHHLLPFFGKVNIAYIPENNKVLGLSKFPRIVDCFSRRLQLQEQMADQIASFLYENLRPKGVLIYVEAEHLCMTMRGIKSIGTITKTIKAKGIFETDREMKTEALNLFRENL